MLTKTLLEVQIYAVTDDVIITPVEHIDFTLPDRKLFQFYDF